MALVRVYCGVSTAEMAPWLTVAVVDDAGRLLDMRHISDDPAGYAYLGALLADRSGGSAPVAIDRHEHLVAQLLAAANRPIAIADEPRPRRLRRALLRRHLLRRGAGAARPAARGRPGPGPAGRARCTPRPRAPRWNLDEIKPVLAAHGAVTAGRQAAAAALREVLRELYPAALRAYPDPAEFVPLTILDALPEPGLLTPSPSSRNRDAALVDELAAMGAVDATTAANAITALRVAVEESPRWNANRLLAPVVAETVRQAVAAVRACDSAIAALVGSLIERLSSDRHGRRSSRPTCRPVPVSPAVARPGPAAEVPVARLASRASRASAAAAGVAAPGLPGPRNEFEDTGFFGESEWPPSPDAGSPWPDGGSPWPQPGSQWPPTPDAGSEWPPMSEPEPGDSGGPKYAYSPSGAAYDTTVPLTRPAFDREADYRTPGFPGPDYGSSEHGGPDPGYGPEYDPRYGDAAFADASTYAGDPGYNGSGYSPAGYDRAPGLDSTAGYDDPRFGAVPAAGYNASPYPASAPPAYPPAYGNEAAPAWGHAEPGRHGAVPTQSTSSPVSGAYPAYRPEPTQGSASPSGAYPAYRPDPTAQPAAPTSGGSPAAYSPPPVPTSGGASAYGPATAAPPYTFGDTTAATARSFAMDPLNAPVPQPSSLRLVPGSAPDPLTDPLPAPGAPPVLRVIDGGREPAADQPADDDLLIFSAGQLGLVHQHRRHRPRVSRRAGGTLADDGWRAAGRWPARRWATRRTPVCPVASRRPTLSPGRPRAAEHSLRIVRDAQSIAAHTDGYFRGWRRGQEIGGFAVGQRDRAAWEFNREQRQRDGTDQRARLS